MEAEEVTVDRWWEVKAGEAGRVGRRREGRHSKINVPERCPPQPCFSPHVLPARDASLSAQQKASAAVAVSLPRRGVYAGAAFVRRQSATCVDARCVMCVRGGGAR